MSNKGYSDLLHSSLYDEKTFYERFLKDLEFCREEVIIESPYITSGRMKLFYPVLTKLVNRKIKIYVMTRIPQDHENKYMREQAEREISNFESMGIQPLLCIGNHHRKLAILDREILWEGSLNILSQIYSREIMRRIVNQELALQMFDFLKIGKFL